MKRRVYRASALAGWIGVIALFVLILSDNAVRRPCLPRSASGRIPSA